MACPICEKKTEETYKPFCSKRCADIDLGKWLTGAYAIAGEPHQDGELEHIDAPETSNLH